jgi:hypothetical protein
MIPRRPAVRYGVLASMLVVTALASSSGCTVEHSPGRGDDDDDDGASASSSASAGSGGASTSSASSAASSGSGGAGGQNNDLFHVSGALTFDRVPYDNFSDGLDYGSTKVQPIRGASVRLLDAFTNEEIANTTSDDQGAYTFAYPKTTARVKLWLYSETEVPSIIIEDNTSGDSVYVLESAEVDSAEDAKLDLHAASGWSGSGYASLRASAPFAILDAAYTAARRFLDEVDQPPFIPELRINWSVDNRPEDGDVANGQISTSHWDDAELYILGKEDVDTDEFDDHVIVHEWGHSFEARLSRSDSLGGSHGYGDVLDPRVAWSEGFCNALSAIILEPNTFYADSSGPGQSDGFADDLEANDKSAESNPGWYSEQTVQNIVFDLYDGANEPFDQVGVGIKGVYAAMAGGHKDTPALTTLFSFVAAIKTGTAQAVPGIDALVTYHTLNSSFGVNAVADAWGTGETHGGGVTGSLPLFTKAAIGGAYTANFLGGKEFNSLFQNRYFQWTGDGQTAVVKSQCTRDVDIFVYHNGQLVDSDESLDGNETVFVNTTAGETYVLAVQGFHNTAVSYSATITFTH